MADGGEPARGLGLQVRRSVASHGSCSAPRRRRPAAARPAAPAATGPSSGSIPEAAATASPVSRRGNGNSTLAQIPRPSESRCVSQRSIPRVGTETSSGANGSAGGSASRRAERLDEAVGTVGSVDVEHRVRARVVGRPPNLTASAGVHDDPDAGQAHERADHVRAIGLETVERRRPTAASRR